MQVNKVIISNRDTQAKIGQNSIEGFISIKIFQKCF